MNIEEKEEECTICLENIVTSSSIGTIQSCHHYYHEDCILQWSSHSNSCPTCRKLFYKIETSKCGNPTKIEKVISIRDKLLPNDAIDQIPSEYIIRSYSPSERENNQTSLDQIVENYSSNNKLCSICSSSDYRNSLTRNLIFCNNCPSAFHQNCLGIDIHGTSDDFSWCCPMCDTLQDIPVLPTYQSHAGSNRVRGGIGGNIRPRAKRVRTPRTIRSLINSRITDSVFRNISSANTHVIPNASLDDWEVKTNTNQRQRPGLVIHNENDELDDDFLYSNVSCENDIPNNSYSQPIMNGGVILRKELKDKQNLSKEEAQSWDIFDQARKCQDDGEVTDSAMSLTLNGGSEPQRRRRRKKISTPIETETTKTEGTSANIQNQLGELNKNTRISNLISQVRSASQAGHNKHDINFNVEVIQDDTQKNESINRIESSLNTDSEPKPKFTRKKTCPGVPTNVELSLEQKNEIQKHIRNNLRPLYRPGKHANNETPTIKSEDVYIEINKSASRKIYAHIQSLVMSGTSQTRSSILVDYFNQDQSKLKSVVDRYVQDELKYYKW